jgi:sugar (pentulose or hexulose) kinase
VPILQVDDPVSTTLRGTALAALAALGHRSLADIANLVKIKKVYQPDESTRETYDRMYTRYRELFKRNRKIFKALNSQN